MKRRERKGERRETFYMEWNVLRRQCKWLRHTLSFSKHFTAMFSYAIPLAYEGHACTRAQANPPLCADRPRTSFNLTAMLPRQLSHLMGSHHTKTPTTLHSGQWDVRMYTLQVKRPVFLAATLTTTTLQSAFTVVRHLWPSCVL